MKNNGFGMNAEAAMTGNRDGQDTADVVNVLKVDPFSLSLNLSVISS